MEKSTGISIDTTFRKKIVPIGTETSVTEPLLTELVLSSTENLETITRLKSKPHPCMPSPAFWRVQDEHPSCKLLQHSGNVSGLLVAHCVYNSEELVCSVWCFFAAFHSQSQPVSPSEIRTLCQAWTTKQRNSHLRCQAGRTSRTSHPPAKLKPQPRGYGHAQRWKQKPKHTAQNHSCNV